MQILALKKFIGGLGNQCFQVVSIYSLSRILNIPFKLPGDQTVSLGFINSPCYKNTVFRKFYEIYDNISTDNINKITLTEGQWCKITDLIPRIKDIIANNPEIVIEIDSMLMSVENFFGFKDELRLLFTDVVDTNKNVICISARRFIAENHTEWASGEEYYKNALEYLHIGGYLENNFIEVYADEKEWLENVLTKYGIDISTIKWNIGVRDNITDVEHFKNMFRCNVFVLCNSTFHYWPAVLTNSPLVICDKTIDWQVNNVIPKNNDRWVML